MTNLFKGWDKNCIAVAAERIGDIDLTVCENYYQLGYCESKRRFPFNLIEKKFKSGVIKPLARGIEDVANDITLNSKKYPYIAKLYDSFLIFSGLYHFSRNIKITNNLLQWIDTFRPDIIYTQLASLELIKFVTAIHKEIRIPIAIHIMDDWPSTISKPGILQTYWENRIDREFKKLLDKTSVFLSIGDAMSIEYEKRYRKKFIAFHNPIELEKWLKYSKCNWDFSGIFRIIYTGRLGIANFNSVFKICNVINSMVEKGLKIKLDIFTSDFDSINAKKIQNSESIKVIKNVSHSEIPQLLSSYDLLILPLDFTTSGIKFAKYSIPTKASEYMISGTPILLYASAETALCQHALMHNWAYVVSENNSEMLKEAINNLTSNELLRRDLAIKAKAFAIQHFNADIVRENFRLKLSSVL